MSDLAFSVVGMRAERYGAAPLAVLRLRIQEQSGARVHAAVLRIQVQLEPQRRRYAATESARLVELFGEPERYAQTLRPLLWTYVAVMIPEFSGETEADVLLPCSYDFEVAAHKYLTALDDGEIPLRLLFSGVVFVRAAEARDFVTELVPWDREATCGLPVSVWREAVEAFFPNSAWIRLGRDSFETLRTYKAAHSLRSWDTAIDELCARAESLP